MDFFKYICRVFSLDDFECFCVETVFCAARIGQSAIGITELVDIYLKDCTNKDMAMVWQYFLSDSILMRYFFVPEKDFEGLYPKRLMLHPRMLAMLSGDIGNTEAVSGTEIFYPSEDFEENHVPVPESEKLMRLVRARQSDEKLLAGLCGAPGSGRRQCVRALFQKLNKPVLIADAKVLGLTDEDRQVYAVNEILRECIFFQAGLMLSQTDAPGLPVTVLSRLFENLSVVFVSSEEKYFYQESWRRFETFWQKTGLPEFETAKSLWAAAFKDMALEADVSFEEMAGKYALYPGMMMAAAALAKTFAKADGRSVICRRDLSLGCHELLSAHMGKKVIRIQPAFLWENLVLPAYQKQQLMTACSQIRQRNRIYEQWGQGASGAYGRGISIVFSGLPGTGKTMAAQVLANALELELYKVNLAAVVSKFIGETEKNLEEIFLQAKSSQAILFFDEADVLFSRRTEVKSSNDKYSNMEAAYMLQKMEAYDGVTVLSTNYLQNFDEAFKRRMKMIIEFPFPDRAGRRLLWRQIFPQDIAVEDDIDIEYLASQFEFSGSNIKNAAQFAAFTAADSGRPVSMTDIAAGIKNECAKIGKTLRPEEMGEYYMLF